MDTSRLLVAFGLVAGLGAAPTAARPMPAPAETPNPPVTTAAPGLESRSEPGLDLKNHLLRFEATFSF